LPLLAPIGAAGFTAAWAVLGEISPGYQMWDIVVPSYSPIAQPVSGLGLGETALAMNTAFIVSGGLMAVGAWAAARSWPRTGAAGRWARALVTLGGIGTSLCGLFTLESMMLHSLGFLLAIGGPAVGFVLAARVLRDADPWLSRALLAAGPASLALMVLFLATFDPQAAGGNEGMAGLVERILITLVLGAIGAIGWRASRAMPALPPTGAVV
jgi:hypothetical membrane protein